MLIALLTFLLIVAVTVGCYWVLAIIPERKAQAALRRRLQPIDRPVPAAEAQSIASVTELSSLKILNRLLANSERLTQPFQRLVDQSGLRVTVGTVVMACAVAAMLGFLSATSVSGSRLSGFAAGAVGVWVPIVWLRLAQHRRRRKFEELFPEALEIIARALRAGHTLPAGFAMAAESVPEPVSGEFRLLYESQNYGRPLADALRTFAERSPVLDARFFVTAVLVQRETGGNLSEILDNLVTVIRQRFTVKRQVRALTAQGRFSGWILAAAPPVLAGVLMIVNPDHVQALLTDPIGIRLVAAAIALQIIGTLVVRRIVNVEY